VPAPPPLLPPPPVSAPASAGPRRPGEGSLPAQLRQRRPRRAAPALSPPARARADGAGAEQAYVPMLGGKQHGSLARAGKVRGQTPKVEKQDKKKKVLSPPLVSILVSKDLLLLDKIRRGRSLLPFRRQWCTELEPSHRPRALSARPCCARPRPPAPPLPARAPAALEAPLHSSLQLLQSWVSGAARAMNFWRRAPRDVEGPPGN